MMRSPQPSSRFTIRIPGRSTIRGPDSSNKENSPVASMGGGDVINSRLIPGTSKVIHDVFDASPVRVSPRRPSEYWLKSPAWIDGALNPPHFYYSHREIAAALRAAGKDVPARFVINESHGVDEPPSPRAPFTQVPSTRYSTPPQPTPPTSSSLVVPSQSSDASVLVPSELPVSTASSATAGNVLPAPGRLIAVTMTYDEIIPGATHHAKSKLKKNSETKTNVIDIDNLNRVQVLQRAFEIHGIAEKYNISPMRGPDFKLWFTGAGGGKAGAPTISTDDDFAVIMNPLRRKPAHTNVGISFDLDGISAFKIRAKRALALEDDDLIGPGGELNDGFKVPRIDMYSASQQLHGLHAQHIKNEWQCQQHLGENGRPGACYIKPGSGTHIGLNMRRLAAWAAAMAAGEATKYQPPNIPDFDGVHDGSVSMSRSRGRSGPSQPTALPSTSSSSAAEQALSVMTAFFNAQARTTAPPPLAAAMPTPPSSIPRRKALVVSTPLPPPAEELQRFLEDLNRVKAINVISSAGAFDQSGVTPDIIPYLPVTRIAELTGLREGPAVKLQLFSKDWVLCLEEQRLIKGFD